jgi:hypothetical protein
MKRTYKLIIFQLSISCRLLFDAVDNDRPLSSNHVSHRHCDSNLDVLEKPLAIRDLS